MKSIKPGLSLIDHAIKKYNPAAVFAMFSGGHDSLTAAYIASQHPKFTAAVHINTGIGIEKTREFVRETCKAEGWPLLEYKAIDCGQDYRRLVLEAGFPGPFHHDKMYNRLKERPLRRCIKDHKRNRLDHIVLVTGCRSQESTRRMGHVAPIQKEASKIWTAVIHDWTKTDCNEFLSANEIKRNEVVDLLHMSGECLCGAFAHKGELKELGMWFPDVAAKIKALEKEVHAAGHHWGWEDRKPEWCLEADRGQKTFFPMCVGCGKKYEGDSDEQAAQA